MKNLSPAAGKRTLKAIVAAVVALLVIVAIFVSTAFAGGYQVTVVDGAQEFVITTNETEPIAILKSAGISLTADDKLDLKAFQQGKGGSITVNRLNSINVAFGKNMQTFRVYGATVGEALAAAGLDVNETAEMNYALSDGAKNGMVIEIRSADSVTLVADGSKLKFAKTTGTVGDLLKMAGVTLGGEDYVKPSQDTPLTKDMKIKVYRVTYKEVSETEEIPFEEKTEKDSTQFKGVKTVKVKGVKGSKDVTYNVKYINGKEAERTVLTETVTQQPVTQVVKVGTKKSTGASATPNGVTSRGGYTVGQKISGRYTHYCACAICNGNGRGITSSGKKISNGMANPYYIACNWLPLGSVVNVDGTNYTVVDRGGSGLSKVGRIDIFTPEGHAACYRLGTGSCNLEIVRIGW